MYSVIRKISIGADYKNDAMHYSVGQQVYGGHVINNIDHSERDNSYNIFITKEIKVKLGEANTVLIALIDRIRMLDNDIIRLKSKVKTTIELKENLEKKKSYRK